MHPESARDRDAGLPLDPDTLPPSARPSVADIGLVAVGGSLGTGLRYGLGAAIPHWGPVPIATFGINVVGAFVLGWLLETLLGHERRTWARRLRLGVGTGVLGGFTTYSALATDTAVLLGTHPGLGVAYAVATVGLGGVASVAGIWAARGRR